LNITMNFNRKFNITRHPSLVTSIMGGRWAPSNLFEQTFAHFGITKFVLV